MKILCLYCNPCALELFEWLSSNGHEAVLWTEHLDADWCRREGFDLTVSYTYRYLISQTVLDALGNNVVNLHNSVLPWNRGADPNIWSYLDNTPRGVTLHYVDAQLDKGHIIAQNCSTTARDRPCNPVMTIWTEPRRNCFGTRSAIMTIGNPCGKRRSEREAITP